MKWIVCSGQAIKGRDLAKANLRNVLLIAANTRIAVYI